MPTNRSFMFSLLVSALMVLAVLTTLTVQAPLEGKILNPIADSDVRSGFPDWNRGWEWTLWVERFVLSNNSEIIAFLMFDLSPIPAGSTIDWAGLRLHAHAVDIKALVGVYYCSGNDWTEEGITYNNKPTFSSEPLDTANVTKRIWYEWNVTGTVKSAFQGADKRLSLVLKADSRGTILFDSRHAPYVDSSPHPQLDVRYWPPPPTENSTLPTIIVAIIVIGAAATTTALSYTILKRRKTRSPMQRKT